MYRSSIYTRLAQNATEFKKLYVREGYLQEHQNEFKVASPFSIARSGSTSSFHAKFSPHYYARYIKLITSETGPEPYLLYVPSIDDLLSHSCGGLAWSKFMKMLDSMGIHDLVYLCLYPKFWKYMYTQSMNKLFISDVGKLRENMIKVMDHYGIKDRRKYINSLLFELCEWGIGLYKSVEEALSNID